MNLKIDLNKGIYKCYVKKKEFFVHFDKVKIFTFFWGLTYLFFGLSIAWGQKMLPVFPGAEGFGSFTSAGSGRHLDLPQTRLYRVTNLNDSGIGSLRYGMVLDQPRTIIFEVGGTISLKKRLVITDPYITIAGQTAPDPGITLKNYGIIIADTHDVLVQHLKIRIGDFKKEKNMDGISINSIHEITYNVVIDHLSISWWQDGGIDFFCSPEKTSGIRDVTVTNCLISEGLNFGNHSLATLVGPGVHNLSFIKNLWVHNMNRNPLIAGNTSVLLVNNVCYNSEYYGTVLSNTRQDGPHNITIIGCIVIPGISSKNSDDVLVILENIDPQSKIYFKDLKTFSPKGNVNGVRNDFKQSSVLVNTPPLICKGVNVYPASLCLDVVLKNVGSFPWERDAIDRRVIDDVVQKKGTIINSQSDVGGWEVSLEKDQEQSLPDSPEIRQEHYLPDRLLDDSNQNGYTDLEDWIHSFNWLEKK